MLAGGRGVPAAGRDRQRLARYAGDVGIGINPALAERVRECRLLLVVGPRLGEMTTSGYTLLDVPQPRQTLVHVHPGAEELGRVYQAELPILSGMAQFARSGPRPTRGAALGASGRRRRGRTTKRGSSTTRFPARSTSATASRTSASACPTRSSRNGAGNHTVWVASLLALPRLSEPARADERRDGLRRSGGSSPRRACCPSATSSASPATVTS